MRTYWRLVVALVVAVLCAGTISAPSYGIAPSEQLADEGWITEIVGVPGSTARWAVLQENGPDRPARYVPGSGWTKYSIPDGGGIHEIAMTGPNDGWAAGGDSSGASYLLRWNGESWQRVRIPGISEDCPLSNVSASAPGNVWVTCINWSDSERVQAWHRDSSGTWTQTFSDQIGGSINDPDIQAVGESGAWVAGNNYYDGHPEIKRDRKSVV